MNNIDGDIWSDTTGEKYLYRYRPDSIFTIDEIQENYIFLSDSSRLNDLNECRYYLNDDYAALDSGKRLQLLLDIVASVGSADESVTAKNNLIAQFAHDEESANRLVKEQLDRYISVGVEEFQEKYKALKYGIICFSKKSMNPTMMAHYSGNSGAVICYDANKVKKFFGDTLLPVKYEDQPVCLNLTDVIFGQHKDCLPLEVLRKIVSQKHTDWKYEDEVRVVSNSQVDVPVSMEAGTIVGVCAAVKASGAFLRVLSGACEKTNSSVYRASLGNDFNYVPKKYSYKWEELE